MSATLESSGPHSGSFLSPYTNGRPAQLLVLALRETAVQIGRQLASEGFAGKWRLHIAHSVTTGWQRMNETNFDLILCDLNIEEIRLHLRDIVSAAGATLVYGLCDDERGEIAIAARRDGVADVLSAHHLHGPSTARLMSLMLDSARTASTARLLAAAVEAAPVAYAMCDALQSDMPLIYVNEHFVTLTGYEPSDVIGRNCRFLQGPQTDSRDVDRIREAIRKAQPIYIELVNYRKDGQPFWNGMLLRPIRSLNGTVTHFVATLRDMSERRQTEESLARSARLHRLLVAASGGMTLYADAAGSLRAPLPEFEAFTSLRFDEYRNCDWSAAVHPDDRTEFLAKRAAALDTPTRRIGDPNSSQDDIDSRAGLGCLTVFRLWHAPSKQWRYMELRMVPLHDTAGVLSEWIGTLTDVHDRAASERAQQHSRRFLEAALDTAPGYLLYVDRSAVVRWANRRCLEWLGRTLESLQGSALLELTDAAGRESLPRRMRAAFAGRAQHFSEDIALCERRETLDVTLIPYREENDRVTGFFWVAADPNATAPFEQPESDLSQ